MFLEFRHGLLAAVKYAALSQFGTVQINEMYSYTEPYASNIYPEVYGGGLPAAKRLQVSEYMTYQNVQGHYQNATVSGNLDTTFAYNAEGGLISTTYPSTTTTNGNGTIITTPGPSYNYSYDSMYRLSGMTDSNYNTIVSGVSYNAASQLLSINYPGNNERRSYNVLNQLTNVTAGSENLTYNYPTGANNGKVSSMYNAVSGETVTYTYDSLNRLLTANGSGWGDQYGFDGFGNLLSKTVTAGSAPSMSISVNPANNQIQGVGLTYDANGNTTTAYNGGVANTLTYDAENRVSTYQPYIGLTTTYAYDTQNHRIWSWPGTTDSWGNVTGYTVNIYTPSGQKLAAYTLAPAFYTSPFLAVGLSSSDQYFGSRRLAPMDQLGSVGTYFPWGENKGGTNPQDTWSFATYWQDSVSGLDYANNRYYSNAYGRFMTPDPYMASGGPGDPQSWNRYAYTRGDPINRYDPAGTDDSTPTFTDTVWSYADDYWDYSGFQQQMYAMFCVSDPACYAAAMANAGVGEGGGSPAAAHITVQTASGTTQDQKQALDNGIDSAWAHILSNPQCASFLTGNKGGSIVDAWAQLATTLSNTTYTFSNSLPFNTAAQTTEGGNQVTINSSAFMSGGSGLYTATTTNSQGQVTNYLFTNSATVDALTLLHELGHETGVLPADVTDASQNAANTADIVKNCFTKTANGTYQ